MDLTIPFSKEIVFKNNIAEICSISLEEDVSINDTELLGDFILEGEYKNLDINVDTMPFNHVVPFSINLDRDIDLNTLSYEIKDFSYDVIGSDTLKVDIKFHIKADKLTKRIDEVFENVDSVLDENDNISSLDVKDESTDDLREEDVIRKNENIEVNQNDNLIINNDLEEDFITYHVHIVKVNETIDAICKTYNVSKETLLEINDINNISMGDKLIIPEIIED